MFLNAYEAIATLFAIAYCIAIARQQIICWLFALISNLAFVKVLFDSNLPQQSLLYVFYIFVTVYGYYQWRNNKTDLDSVTRLTAYQYLIGLLLIIILCSISISLDFLSYSSRTLLIVDSISVWSSVVATLIAAHKKIDNWYFWIVINTLNVYLYLSSTLYLMIFLSFIYQGIAIYGIYQWRRHLPKTNKT